MDRNNNNNNRRQRPHSNQPPNNISKKNNYNNRSRNPNQSNNRQSSHYISGSDITLHQHTLKDTPKRSSNNNYHRPRYRTNQSARNNRPDTLTLDKVFKRYSYLCELHLIARRKYFENCYKADLKLVKKLEDNFDNTLKHIYDFKSQLTDYQKQKLEELYDSATPDTSYSENHNLNPKGNGCPEQYQIVDPHILDKQKRPVPTTDLEETTGTIDDYIKYKENSNSKT